MSDTDKTAAGEVMRAFEEFKATNDKRLAEIEKKGVADPTTEAKLVKIEGDIARFEDLNQKVTASDQEAKAAKEELAELKGKFDGLSTALRRTGGSADPAERAQELKAARNHWARGVIASTVPGMQPTAEQLKALADVDAEFKALSVNNDSTGGYLAPAEYVREIIKGVTEISAPRLLVRVRSTGAKSIMLPKRTGQFAAQRVAEQGTRSETDGLRYGMVEIVAPEMFALIDISQQNLEDSAFDLEAELSMEAVEQFAVKEGTEFVSGTGVGEMEGILTNADVSATNSGSATTIKGTGTGGDGDGLLSLKYGIKTAYARNATWIMNRTTLGSVRRLKDGQGAYVWQPGIADGRPNTIDGDPYVEVPDMPSEGVNTYPVAYGDFRRAYSMVDRVAMQLLRDPYTQATSGNIRFLFRRRVGGAVVLAEAIRKLKCST
jgi:HK97 family phage major capsid protein